MSLQSGTRLGPYEILSPIGAGGMGEVYKAKDTRLDRTVAIKVLPEHLSKDPERRERFEREARAVSSLNHPHICTLHDIGQHDEIDFMVMEYIEGNTLADRLKNGPLPLDQALQFGIQIADALDKAHRQGVVHRDLKPGNIMLTKPGVKLLDFGLAKLTGSLPPEVRSNDSEQPTQQKPLTNAGAILGTVMYMAPEQLEGKEADERADMFAFGAILYEMVTGRKAFEGESQASLITAIMSSDPPPLSEFQALSPPALDRFVRKCLIKDPEDRWQTARDVTTELAWVREAKDARPAASAARRKSRPLLWVGALVIAIGLAGVAFLRMMPRSVPTVARLTVNPRLRLDLANSPSVPFAISPDGQRLVFAGKSSERPESQALYIRNLDRFDVQRIPETEGAVSPFFSPRGRWVGFHADGTLKKVSLDGGPPVEICRLSAAPWGASWGADGTIVYGASGSGLWRVPDTGGMAEPLTSLGPEEIAHADPHVLPNGKNVIFSANTSSESFITLLSFEKGERRPLFQGNRGRYLPTQHIIYAVSETLLAVPFDPATLELGETPTPLPEKVQVDSGSLTSYYDLSSSGSLVYAATDPDNKKVVWVDRSGREAEIADVESGAHEVRLSPDGRRFAMDVVGDQPAIWNYDVERGTRVLVSQGSDGANILWAPDGQEVWFTAGSGIYAKAADGTGDERLLFDRDFVSWPISLSPDGRFLAITETHPETGRDIWVLSSDGEPVPFVVTPANENAAAFSPNGRWIAYQSDATGRNEIYVQPFSDPGTRVLVSTEGGTAPAWSPNGRELFYRAGTALMSAAVRTENGFEADKPSLVLDGPYQLDPTGHPSYDVARTGERFLMLRTNSSLGEIRVVLGWSEQLKGLAFTEK